MYNISLINKSFLAGEGLTIFGSAKDQNVILEHSCLSARCRSCVAKVLSGSTESLNTDFVLSEKERAEGYILTCNAIPKSDLILDVEDLSDYALSKSKIFPAKIQSIDYLTDEVVHLKLRMPPSVSFNYLSGQYVNIIRGNIKRSYSIANGSNELDYLEFFIKKYDHGTMSKYWFEEAKPNDLLRVEGPLGTFFLRDTLKKNIVFLATGTGIAPVNSILNSFDESIFDTKNVYLFWGEKKLDNLFLEFNQFERVEFLKVLSREKSENTYQGYVQDALLSSGIDLEDSQIYACGSNEMIKSARELLISLGLDSKEFYSDAFVISN